MIEAEPAPAAPIPISSEHGAIHFQVRRGWGEVFPALGLRQGTAFARFRPTCPRIVSDLGTTGAAWRSVGLRTQRTSESY